MRKSAFIRRYRTALSTTDPSEVNIKPVRLFENTNPRFAVSLPKEQEETQPFSFSNEQRFTLRLAGTDQPGATLSGPSNNHGE
ncbi:hypothetical protein FO519_004393 [Halicephalobus sp. NKZ332]|nr:hypothetical protein FO519_004393 [Halicephalobus sp. NKZ332]